MNDHSTPGSHWPPRHPKQPKLTIWEVQPPPGQSMWWPLRLAQDLHGRTQTEWAAVSYDLSVSS